MELVNSAGLLLADLTARADGRSLTKSRNEADEITWSIDLNEYERYCRLLKVDPTVLLIPNSTEVRLRRGQSYLSGGQVTYIETYLAANQNTISVRATGFLNLFKDRYTSAIFTATDGSAIASSLITTSQTGTNADFGVTIGTLATTGNHDRSYNQTNIKDALQNMTDVQTNPFDFEFTYDKRFNTYARMGSQRPEIIFEYPGNINSARIPLDGTGTANQITVLGSGFGTDASAFVTVNSTASQANYKIRQKIVTSNAKTDPTELTEDGNTELAMWAFPTEIPQVEVDGNVAPFITDYGIGDYVQVRFIGHRWLDHINALYRIEKFVLNVDSSDNESITLYLSR